MKIRIALIFIIIGFYCCQSDDSIEYQSVGEILGPDLGMCICCGGWHITIEGTTYNFDSIPANSDIVLQKETFPLFVKLDWKLPDTPGCPKRITIQRMRKQ